MVAAHLLLRAPVALPEATHLVELEDVAVLGEGADLGTQVDSQSQPHAPPAGALNITTIYLRRS